MFNTVNSQFIAPPVTSTERSISVLHGGKKSTSPDPVCCILWVCVDQDITAYQTAHMCTQSVRLGTRYDAQGTHALMISMYAWIGLCVRFPWQQCADTVGKRVVNYAMGYINWSMSTLGGKNYVFHVSHGWRNELWIPHPTVLSWRHLISTDGIRYSWAFALSLATFPDQPLSLVEIRAFKDHPWRGACQQWLRRLTWIIYLDQSTRAHSSCVSTANNEAGEDAFML